MKLKTYIGVLYFVYRELEKITVEGDDLYLPTATNKIVRGIQLDSGIPLQSAAKVPIMITFNVIDKEGDPNDVMPQACIFKVYFVLFLLHAVKNKGDSI
jgi:phosphatidylinositol 4-kinase A